MRVLHAVHPPPLCAWDVQEGWAQRESLSRGAQAVQRGWGWPKTPPPPPHTQRPVMEALLGPCTPSVQC